MILRMLAVCNTIAAAIATPTARIEWRACCRCETSRVRWSVLMLLPPLLQVLATLAVTAAQLTFLYHSSPSQLTISVFAHVRPVLQREPTGPMRASPPALIHRSAVHPSGSIQCPTCALGLRCMVLLCCHTLWCKGHMMSPWCGTVAVNAGVALQLPCSSRVPWARHAAHPLSAVDINQLQAPTKQ